MAEYIDKVDLEFLEIPIAPVLQGEQVHYEQGFLKEWLESVPIADVVERSKIDKAIEEIKALAPKPTAEDVIDGNPVKDAVWETLIEVDNILKRNIGE